MDATGQKDQEGKLMPLYDYCCHKCGHTSERFYKIADFPSSVKCECGGVADKVCNCNVVRDEPSWLPSACDVLLDSHSKPIVTRTDFKRYLKANNIVQK